MSWTQTFEWVLGLTSLVKIDINDICYQSEPCGHYVTLTYKNGYKRTDYMFGDDIYRLLAEHSRDNIHVTGCSVRHFTEYEYWQGL